MENNISEILSSEELALAEVTLNAALKAGAGHCRVTLSKSKMNLYGTLNGELDKTSSCLDRALSLAVFADGRFGTFSTNRLDKEELEIFAVKAVESARLLAEDECRRLPDFSRTVHNVSDGNELGNACFEDYASMTEEKRVDIALKMSMFGKSQAVPEGFRLISEEGEYSDSIADTYIIDSNGTKGRQIDTSFEHGVEVTVEDASGNRLSAYDWQSAPKLSRFLELDPFGDSSRAIAKAVAKANAAPRESRKYTMMVSSDCSSRLLTPLLNALGGYALQQKNSFLMDSLGKQIFPETLTVLDMPREYGKNGARLFDSEGVATENAPVIENGTVKRYFISTYIAEKTGLQPTVDDVSRAVTVPFEAETLPEEYILVTGFNGGNCNKVTGDFSYGVEGFHISGGKRSPIKEMLITGNMLTLWNSLIQILPDAAERTSHQIGSLVFKDVDFSGED